MLSLATMRESRPPVRLFDPVHVVLPLRNVLLKPFAGQPRKYSCPRRLPGLEIKISQVPGAGYGLFLREKVYAGQSITLYRREIVSEATARTLKKKVSPFFDFKPNLELIPKQLLTGKSTHSSQPCGLLLLRFQAKRITRLGIVGQAPRGRRHGQLFSTSKYGTC